MRTKSISFLIFLCIGLALSAQENDTEEQIKNEVEVIAIEACDCLNGIKLDIAKVTRYRAINDCIKEATTSYQTNEGIKNALGIGKDSTITNVIVIDEKKYMRDVQTALLRKCPKMELLMSNDDVESEISVSDKKKAVEFYEKGIESYLKKDFKSAINFYKKALKKDKKFAFAWDNLGLSYRQINQYQKAIVAYDNSLALDPTGRVPLMNKPIAYLMDGKLEEAIQAYKDFSEVFPNDPEGYYGISRVYIETKEFELALDNVLNAFVRYNEINSPYARDAEQVIQVVYNNLKANDMLDVWDEYVKKYNITVGE